MTERFTETLRQASQPAWSQSVGHRFVRELLDGSVSDAVMAAVVDAARGLAGAGDTVLLAPAGASFDQFSGYGQRGDAFAGAVRAAIG